MKITLELVDGVAAGSWILDALGDELSPLVRGQIPPEYAAYVRIFHPATDSAGNQKTWTEVAEACGRVAHGEMQWNSIVGTHDSDSLGGSQWSGSRPAIGGPPSEVLTGLVKVLNVSNLDDCFFGLSTIYGGVEGLAGATRLLKFQYREYAILYGSLAALRDVTSNLIGVKGSPDGELSEGEIDFLVTPPNLVWPSDHAWFIASEFDFDSTLVGGSGALIDQLVNEPSLEAYIVEPDMSLADDADSINGRR